MAEMRIEKPIPDKRAEVRCPICLFQGSIALTTRKAPNAPLPYVASYITATTGDCPKCGRRLISYINRGLEED